MKAGLSSLQGNPNNIKIVRVNKLYKSLSEAAAPQAPRPVVCAHSSKQLHLFTTHCFFGVPSLCTHSFVHLFRRFLSFFSRSLSFIHSFTSSVMHKFAYSLSPSSFTHCVCIRTSATFHYQRATHRLGSCGS